MTTFAVLDREPTDEEVDEFVTALLDYSPRSDWWDRLTIVRHLAGQHDQKSHAHGSGVSTGTGTKDDPIRTGDVVTAQKALAAGKYVELDSPRTVSTLLDRMHATVKDAEARGAKAPNYDLCHVSVPRTNLFCSQSKGIPRAQMPQLKGRPVPGSTADGYPKNAKGEVDLGPAFTSHLQAKGIAVRSASIDAKYLKASQSEIDGAKVVNMAQAMRDGKIPNESIFVTKDDYVVDGHHRWAATVGNEYQQGKSLKMDVNVIDSDIISILKDANDFAAEMGLPPQEVFSRSLTFAPTCSSCEPADELRHLAGQHDQKSHAHGSGGEQISPEDQRKAVGHWQASFQGCREIQGNPDSELGRAFGQALEASPRVTGVVYRGVSEPAGDPADTWQGRVGQRVKFNNPVSASPDLATARRYGDVLFEVSGGDARDIRGLSVFPNYPEVVVRPATFGVVGVRAGPPMTETVFGPLGTPRPTVIVTIVQVPEGL